MSRLADLEKEVRYLTARTLAAIGSNAAAAAPALEAARADPETIVSNAVTRALRKVSGEVAP
jgi:HEAT repeat protein